jgi:pimeloyl-ACP methyl ester carboxylesterase
MGDQVVAADFEVLTIPTRGGMFRTRVLTGGRGWPLLWLHGGQGLSGWEPQLAALAKHFTVYAPVQPGFAWEGAGESSGVEYLEDLWDLTLFYCDLLDALVLDSPFVVGHSYGGMLAAELAAMAPDRVGKLVLVSALGLWRPDAPIQEAPTLPAADKFCRPLSGLSLTKRIWRVAAPTLLLWGRSDKVVPPVYAYEFARHLPSARVALMNRSGHAPFVDQPKRFLELVLTFLNEG